MVLPRGLDWIWLLGVGLLTQLGQIWLTEGLAALPAARATSINYVQVIFATLWGVLIFAEPITFTVILSIVEGFFVDSILIEIIDKRCFI